MKTPPQASSFYYLSSLAFSPDVEERATVMLFIVLCYKCAGVWAKIMKLHLTQNIHLKGQTLGFMFN